MKSKGLTALLSILFGSTGAQRFYLGQNKRGWTYFIIFWIIFPTLVWICKQYNIISPWQYAGFGWLLAIIILHIAEFIRYISMKKESFISEDISKGTTLPLTVISIIAAMAFGYGASNLLHYEKKINIDSAEAELSISSLQLSEAYNNDEETFTQKYEKKVLQVEGTVKNTGNDFIDGNFLALEAASGSPADVNCYFLPDHQDDINGINPGDNVTVIGVCEGRFLRNCKVSNIEKGISPTIIPNTTAEVQNADSM